MDAVAECAEWADLSRSLAGRAAGNDFWRRRG